MSARILEVFPELSVADSAKQVENTMKSIVSVMKAICVLFVLITLFVVVLVEVLLIKSKLIKERRNFGVQKALGFTTPQLIVQTMLIARRHFSDRYAIVQIAEHLCRHYTRI